MKPNLALVVGTGRSMWEDFFSAPREATVFGVNHAAMFLPRVEHAVSLHGPLIGAIATARLSRPAHKGDVLAVHAPTLAPGVTMMWDERMYQWAGQGGTSSLFAVRIAIKLGFTKIFLAGVPLDSAGHFYDPEDYIYATDFSGDITPWVLLHEDEPHVEIRSYSGRTRTIFGTPEVMP